MLVNVKKLEGIPIKNNKEDSLKTKRCVKEYCQSSILTIFIGNFSRLFVIICEIKFLKLLSVNIRKKKFKSGICALSSFHYKKIHLEQRLRILTLLPE